MHRFQIILLLSFLFFYNYGICRPDITPNKVIPTKAQIEYQGMGLIGFIHFNMNTFTNKEWGYGNESPKLFNPKHLNVDQWV